MLKAFEQYYGKTEALPSDPNLIADAAQSAFDWDVIDPEEIDAFADVFTPEASHHLLSARCKHSYEAALALDDQDWFEFRGDLDRRVRFYKFLSQIVPYLAIEHEKLFNFGGAYVIGADARGYSESGFANVTPPTP